MGTWSLLWRQLLEGKPVAAFGGLIHQPEVETGRVLTTPQHYAYLKIAEGCDNRCAYCVIPSLQGPVPEPPDGRRAL